MFSLRPWLICLTSKSAFLCCLLIALVGSPADVSAKWKWKTIPADEAVLTLKGWPTPVDKCRVRKEAPPNYEKENTLFFCPQFLGTDEPRTYFKVSELMPGWFWAGAYGEDFSENWMFTKVKSNWFKYFKNPVIKPGQKTKCYNDNECSFQRIEFSVNGRECQWIYYNPDLGTTDGSSGRSEIPYSLEIFTCQTSVPITKEHIEMKPGKVTVTFPGGSSESGSTQNGNKLKERSPRIPEIASSRDQFPNFYSCCVEVMQALTLDARRGDAVAQQLLGSRYANGKGVKQNFKTAVKWYTQSAKQGNATSQFSLGQIYADGNQGVPKNYKTSLRWYSRAAEQGDLNALFILGQAYAQGTSGALKNQKTALKWYRLAAKQGDEYAQMEVKRLEEKIGSQNASPPNSPQNAPKTNGGGSSITDRLKALKKLEDAGLISKEEAAAKRKEILKNL